VQSNRHGASKLLTVVRLCRSVVPCRGSRGRQDEEVLAVKTGRKSPADRERSNAAEAGTAPESIDGRVVAAGLVGSVVEYYDFGIYGYLATVLSVVFFANGTDPTTALLATFATFAAAFVLRPLGGLLFGHLGDRFGRSRILAATILSMCVATVAIGVLPTYAAIGVGAAIAALITAWLRDDLACSAEELAAHCAEVFPEWTRRLQTPGATTAPDDIDTEARRAP